MTQSLKITSKAIEAACRLNLQQTCDGQGAATVEAFNELIEDFVKVFSRFSGRLSTEEAVDLWKYSHDQYGKLVLDN